MSNVNDQKEQSFSLEKLTGNALVNVSEWDAKIKKVLDENPFVEIIDNATYEAQKKSRTAVKSMRVELEKEDKAIGSAFQKVRKEAGKIYESLVLKVSPTEEKYQNEVDRWETIKQKEKEEREQAEQRRIDSIKSKIDAYESAAMEYIQKMTFADVENPDMSVLTTSEDFEEYDIIATQARDRILNALDIKISDLKKKEAEREEKERLERENAESKKREALQSERLGKLEPVIGFVKGVSLFELHKLSEQEYEAILSNANEQKEESDLKAAESEAEAKRIREEREEKERVEKEKVFEIRKSRLEDLGLQLDHMGCFSMISIDHFVSREDVYNSDTIYFEDIYNASKKAIQEGKEENERILREAKEREDNRVKAEKENAKRQKELAGDKKLITAYVDSLDFRADVPEVKNEGLFKLLESYELTVKVFKENLTSELNNY